MKEREENESWAVLLFSSLMAEYSGEIDFAQVRVVYACVCVYVCVCVSVCVCVCVCVRKKREGKDRWFEGKKDMRFLSSVCMCD